MPTPMVLEYPIKRPGFITNAYWLGLPTDPEISLVLEYVDAQGNANQTVLYTTPVAIASLCLPHTLKTVADLSDDVYIAHVRMAGMVSGAIPGSEEYNNAIKGDGLLGARYFQTPIGDVKVTDIQMIYPSNVQMTFQKTGGGPTHVVVTDVADLSTYSFTPSTQLITVAGAIKKQYPTYIHDAATGKFLTQTQMDTIAAYVMGIEPWI